MFTKKLDLNYSHHKKKKRQLCALVEVLADITILISELEVRLNPVHYVGLNAEV